MKGKDCVTPEKAMVFALKYGCPYEFGFKTAYMDKWCPDGYRQGDCELCWNSEVVEMISEDIPQ